MEALERLAHFTALEAVKDVSKVTRAGGGGGGGLGQRARGGLRSNRVEEFFPASVGSLADALVDGACVGRVALPAASSAAGLRGVEDEGRGGE